MNRCGIRLDSETSRPEGKVGGSTSISMKARSLNSPNLVVNTSFFDTFNFKLSTNFMKGESKVFAFSLWKPPVPRHLMNKTSHSSSTVLWTARSAADFILLQFWSISFRTLRHASHIDPGITAACTVHTFWHLPHWDEEFNRFHQYIH